MANNLVQESRLSDLELLQNFLINNTELDRLEELTDQFNIFEVLGAVRVELRHSEFLAYLLNPSQNHGLGSTFLRRLIERVLLESGTTQEIRPIDLELWDLEDIEVRREWENIDIFLVDDEHKFVVIIENKIKSGESSDQLERYFRTVKHQYLGYKILPIFLTPDGISPSLITYLPVGYQTVCEILDQILSSRKSTLGSEVFILIQHYVQMLRRDIMSDSEISELCRTIYRKHQKALDLIYEYRPDLQAMIHDYLTDLISHTPQIKTLHNAKTEIDFIPSKWDVGQFSRGTYSLVSNKLLYFGFTNTSTALRLAFLIAPGPQDLRQKLLDMALNNHPPFKSAYKKLNQMWNNIYTTTFLTSKDYEEPDLDALKEKIRIAWEKFLQNDLVDMVEVVEEQAWIWENY